MLAITLSVTFLSTMQLLGPPTYKATLLGETTPKTLKLFSPSARYTQGELVVGPLPGKNPFRLQVFKVRHAPGRNQVLEVTDATLEIVDDENSFRDKNASLWDDLTKTAESYGLDITTIDPTHSLALADLKKLVDAKEFNCQHAEVPAKWAALRAEAKKLGVYVYPNDETPQAALDRVKKTKEKRTADATAFRCDEEEVSSKWAALTAEAKKLGVYVYPSYETPQAALDRIQKTRAKRPADAKAFKCSPKEVPAKWEDLRAEAKKLGTYVCPSDETPQAALDRIQKTRAKRPADAKAFGCGEEAVPAKWAALTADAKKLGVYVYPNDETAQAALDRVKKTKEKRTADATAFRCDEEEVSSKWAALTAEAKKLGVYVYPSYETPQAALDRIQKTRAKRPADATAFKCSPKEVPAKAEDAKASWTWKQIISFNVATIVLANVFENMLEGWKDPIRDGKDKRTAKEKARDMAKALINWQMYKANFVQLGRVFAPAKPAEGKTTPSFGKRAVTFAKHKPFIAAGAGVFVAGNVYMAATGLTAKNFKAKYFPVKAA